MSLDRFNNLNQFSETERIEIIARLVSAEKHSQSQRNYRSASWLHNDIHDLVWKINKPHETRLIDNRLIGCREVNWNVLLTDGSRLGDSQHRYFLHFLQKVAYASREFPIESVAPNSITHVSFIGFLICLAKVVYIYRDELDPDENALSKVDSNFIEGYIKRYSEGGTSYVLGYPQQIIFNLYEKALNRFPSQDVLNNPFSMDPNDRAAIQYWLEQNNYISKSTRFQLPHISSSKLYLLLGDPSVTFYRSDRLNALLRFFMGDTKSVIGPSEIRTEFFSHKTTLFEDAKNSRANSASMQGLISDWARLFSMKELFASELPEVSVLRRPNLLKLANTLGAKPGHTGWIPLKVALKYTTESLRWVHVYGEDLINFYLETYQYFYDRGLLNDDGYTGEELLIRRTCRDRYIKNSIPTTLIPLNITSMGNALARGDVRKYGDHEVLRVSPGLADVMSILLGAVIVLVGITKPIRQAEITNLNSDCISFVENDGYWLNQHYGKRNVGDVYDEDPKPIPKITAKALLLIKALSDKLKEIHGTSDPFILRKLFIVPSFGRDQLEISNVTGNNVAKYLDFFCDYVAIPADDYRRRWYVRIHELRKSFLITFFWCYKFASLEAARWVAGHSKSEHIYAYIQANFPGEELPAIEAEYATQLMWDFEAVKPSPEVINVEELHREVCNHFGVNSISLIESNELKDWITLQFQSAAFQIVPYSITSENGAIQQEIAFRVRKQQG